MTEDEAIELARRTAEIEGWTWCGKIVAQQKKRLFGPTYWQVISNYDCAGCNVRIQISDDTGTILSKGFMPR
jgi:hypothetical protein